MYIYSFSLTHDSPGVSVEREQREDVQGDDPQLRAGQEHVHALPNQRKQSFVIFVHKPSLADKRAAGEKRSHTQRSAVAGAWPVGAGLSTHSNGKCRSFPERSFIASSLMLSLVPSRLRIACKRAGIVEVAYTRGSARDPPTTMQMIMQKEAEGENTCRAGPVLARANSALIFSRPTAIGSWPSIETKRANEKKRRTSEWRRCGAEGRGQSGRENPLSDLSLC